MNKLIFIIFLLSISVSFSQTFQVTKVNGKVKFLKAGSDSWQELKTNSKIESGSVLSTEQNSSVQLKGKDINFTLREASAISVSNIKKMSTDELLLALAMENIINTPRKKNNNNSDNTAVYGSEEQKKESAINKISDMGLKRLKGAKQLDENGMKESAIVTAKEIYRKYPETKNDSEYRIYFADLLYEKGLYEEAYDDFSSIKESPLEKTQQNLVDERLKEIGRKLLNK